ncbi:MAG: triacylglycerol lipase [Oscillospiraceae bacterium]|nr:triacylglycerol lipase [Oscillospiraceae bacterium]
MHIFVRILNWVILVFGINSPYILRDAPTLVKIGVWAVLLLYFLVVNIFPTWKKYPNWRLKILGDGAELILAFWVTCAATIPFAVLLIREIIANWGSGWYNQVFPVTCGIVIIAAEAVIFWNGILRVYATSVQLRIKHRVLGLVFGFIFPVNLVMLMIIYIKTRNEAIFETEKILLDKSRQDDKICATKYPILLVHGVFFRDSRLLNYWGRIPAALKTNGAELYYGDQQSALSVEDSAKELAKRIEQIVAETGCGKLNIIAHSKGGLDSRYAISKLDCGKYVASLTTINTPHRGCLFAEYLLGACKPKLKEFVEKAYNKVFYVLGDASPDFMSAVKCLTNSYCEEFNKEVIDDPEVMYQSFGSKATNRRSGHFPLNISYPVVKKYDGDNDGLVALSSAPWGEKFTPLIPKSKHGITHADMIDLNRANIKGFDVREFYVQLVSELKERGF